MNHGTVKLWKFTYGFITNDETGKDIFAHKTNLNNGLEALNADDKVTYDIAKDDNGKDIATNISVI